MNLKSILLIVLLLLSSSFSNAQSGKAQYFISTNDFAMLFKDTIPDQLICTDETGNKFFTGCSIYARLVLRMKDNSEKTILFSTIRLKNGVVSATEETKVWDNKRPCTVPLDEIQVISIRQRAVPWATPYYDLDSLNRLYRFKSDSLENSYTETDRLMIELVPKSRATNDTSRLLENACYHLELKNGKKIQYGVINKITSDSIFMTTVFAPGRSMSKKDNQSDFAFSIQEIKKIEGLESGGKRSEALLVDVYDFLLKPAPKNISHAPCWFTISRIDGEIRFYRLWLAKRGYLGIRYEDGRYYWFEGASWR